MYYNIETFKIERIKNHNDFIVYLENLSCYLYKHKNKQLYYFCDPLKHGRSTEYNNQESQIKDSSKMSFAQKMEIEDSRKRSRFIGCNELSNHYILLKLY